MKYLSIVLLLSMIASCDLRSDTAKKEMEKFESSPTPTISPASSPTPVDPKDSVSVDTAQEGDPLSANGDEQTTRLACAKFNPVKVNGDKGTVTVTGICRQIMVNGDGNDITVEATAEVVFNGTGNTVKHARFVNGKPPRVTENQSGNTVEKISAEDGIKYRRR